MQNRHFITATYSVEVRVGTCQAKPPPAASAARKQWRHPKKLAAVLVDALLMLIANEAHRRLFSTYCFLNAHTTSSLIRPLWPQRLGASIRLSIGSAKESNKSKRLRSNINRRTRQVRIRSPPTRLSPHTRTKTPLGSMHLRIVSKARPMSKRYR
jgi:hypothetical protein